MLKTDIRRVLDRIQVQYRETDYIQLPSIDISSLQDPHGTPTPSPRKHRKQRLAGSGGSGGTSPRIVRKASKLSFGMSCKDKDEDKDKDRAGEVSVNGSAHKEKEKEKELPSRPSDGAAPGPTTPTFDATQSSDSSSFFNVSSNAPTVRLDDVSATLQPDDDSPSRCSNSPARSKTLPPIPRDFAPATPKQQQQVSPPPAWEVADPEVFESVERNTLSVGFGINIVNVRNFFLSSILSSPGHDADFLGPMAAVPWDPIPPCGRRRMAVPDARTSSSD